MEDKTVLRSRGACGDLQYSSLRDSMRADAYAGRSKHKFRSHSLLTMLSHLTSITSPSPLGVEAAVQ